MKKVFLVFAIMSVIFCSQTCKAEDSLPDNYVNVSGESHIFVQFEHGDNMNGGFSSGHASGDYQIQDQSFAKGTTSSFANTTGPDKPGEFWSAFNINSKAKTLNGTDYTLHISGKGKQTTFRNESTNLNNFKEGVSAGNTTGLTYSGTSSGCSEPNLSGEGSGVGWTSIVHPNNNTIVGETYGEVRGVNPGTLQLFGDGGVNTYRGITKGKNFTSGASEGKFHFNTTNANSMYGNPKSETMNVLDVSPGGVYGRTISTSSSQIGNLSQ